MKSQALQNNLTYIALNFSLLTNSIKKLEERNLPLVESIEIFEAAHNKIQSAYGEIGKLVSAKFDRIIKNNPGFQNVSKIRDIIVGKKEVEVEKTAVQHAKYFKYAPVTSVEVKKTFSKWKMILPDRRLSLSTENVNKMLIISCNNIHF